MKSREAKKEAKRQADELMRNPILKAFFDGAEQSLFRRFKDNKADAEAVEQIRLQMLGLEAFQDFMRQTIIDGQMAEREMND